MDPAAEIVAALRARDEAKARELLARNPGVVNAGPVAGGLPLLHMALYARAGSVVDALLTMGAPVSIHEAAILGDTARVRAHAAADRTLVHAPGPDGAPPLHLAAHFDRVETLVALLNLGADPNALCGPPFANRPLHAAAAGGAARATQALLKAGADANAPDANGYAPLHIAAANGLDDACRTLLTHGADAQARTRDGKTATDLARERGHDEVAAALEA